MTYFINRERGAFPLPTILADVHVTKDLRFDGTLTGLISNSNITPGPNNRFLHTDALGAVVWEELQFDNLPAGAENQILRVVGGALTYQNQLDRSNLPDPVVDTFRHTAAAYNLPAAGLYVFDSQDLASADFTILGGVITCLVAGKYKASVTGSFTVSDTTSSYKLDLRKNSVAQDSINSSYVASNGTYANVALETVLDMAANDTVDVLSTLTGAGTGQVVTSADFRLVLQRV